ncbi:MAG: hypothetical protein JXD22_15710 [Sedimentisphaerales bacterium]|nr:hypothetical protein [Sedimentisphaerales bacterium]
MLKEITFVAILLLTATAWAGDAEKIALSDEILSEAQNLFRQTHKNVYAHQNTKDQMIESLASLKALVHAYEMQLNIKIVPPPPAEPNPPVVLQPDAPPPPTYLGLTSPAKDSNSVYYTDQRTRKIPYQKIRVEHTSGDAYVRMHTITVISTSGRQYEFNVGGGKFYLGDGYEVDLARPEFISEIRVHIQHQTGGLRITGLPAPIPAQLPTVIDLGTTSAADDGYATLNTRDIYRNVKFRKLQLKNTGGEEYIRCYTVQINTFTNESITITTPQTKVRPGETLEIDLPHPVQIRSLSAHVQHRTTGLQVQGIR